MKKLVYSVALLTVLRLTFTSCRDTKKTVVIEKTVEKPDTKEGTLEEVGKAIDGAVDATDDAVKATEKAIKKTGDAVEK